MTDDAVEHLQRLRLAERVRCIQAFLHLQAKPGRQQRRIEQMRLDAAIGIQDQRPLQAQVGGNPATDRRLLLHQPGQVSQHLPAPRQRFQLAEDLGHLRMPGQQFLNLRLGQPAHRHHPVIAVHVERRHLRILQPLVMQLNAAHHPVVVLELHAQHIHQLHDIGTAIEQVTAVVTVVVGLWLQLVQFLVEFLASQQQRFVAAQMLLIALQRFLGGLGGIGDGIEVAAQLQALVEAQPKHINAFTFQGGETLALGFTHLRDTPVQRHAATQAQAQVELPLAWRGFAQPGAGVALRIDHAHAFRACRHFIHRAVEGDPATLVMPVQAGVRLIRHHRVAVLRQRITPERLQCAALTLAQALIDR